MKLEKPCSPGHCLGMLNANMRTDVLRAIHEGVEKRRANQGTASPLEMLIGSIDDVLRSEKQHPSIALGPNPFNTESVAPFNLDSDYEHDLELLRSQLTSLREILADINDCR